jgi:glutamine amidotransferase
MESVAVVDYGMGNLRSVAKAVEHVAGPGTRVDLTDDPGVIAGADRVIVPGQGAARECMGALRQHGLVDVLIEAIARKPFLGICMGLQVLMERSDENGGTDCLGVVPGTVHRFADHPDFDTAGHKVPHMGWNGVRRRPHPLWEGIADGARFYFVHSYYVQPDAPELVTGTAEYGIEFACAVGRGNLFAVQFHPEKSAADGLRLLANFVRWDGTE